MSRLFVVCLLALLSYAQNTTKDDVKLYDDAEAYNVYSAVLALEKAKGDVLIADTTISFSHCTEPRSDRPVDAAIEDYKKANQHAWRLGYHFPIQHPYKILSPSEGGALLEHDDRTGQWPLSPDHGIYRFSAVGFNPERTVAFVEMDVICGGLCGHGSPYVLQKKTGKWVEYVPRLDQNPDGSWTLAPITICSWNY